MTSLTETCSTGLKSQSVDVGFHRFTALTVHGPMIICQWIVIIISGQCKVKMSIDSAAVSEVFCLCYCICG